MAGQGSADVAGAPRLVPEPVGAGGRDRACSCSGHMNPLDQDCMPLLSLLTLRKCVNRVNSDARGCRRVAPTALLGQQSDTVPLVTSEDARDARLSTVQVATILGLDRRTVLRIPKDRLDYWLTPGGGFRQHRRYRLEDVRRYAREWLEKEI